MSNCTPVRYDIDEIESNVNFVRNLFYGQWTGNEFLGISMECGDCGAITHSTIRQLDSEAVCANCGAVNKL